MLSVINAVSALSTGNGFEPQKIKITPEKGKALELTGLLNPTELKINRKVQWQPSKSDSGGETPFYNYSGGTDDLDFSIVLDASESANDLADEIEALYDLTYPLIKDDSNYENGRPPVVNFEWGEKFKFGGIVTSVGITVSLFDDKGAFKRATVAIKMEGYAFASGPVAATFLSKGPEETKEAAKVEDQGAKSGPFSGFPF